MAVLLAADAAGIAEAARWLRDGRLVAFGTETVYGLGARADADAPIAALYAAKRRPAHNPLICHYPSATAAALDALFDARARALADAFWPGPLTLVLPRAPGCRISLRAGPADTLAVRVPGHAIALALLDAVALPIVAPSANRSGTISPTSAHHVLAGLGADIDAVLDCGGCSVGIESTVVDLSGPGAALLRPGIITAAEIEAVIGPLGTAEGAAARSPGLLLRHYAPRARLRLDAMRCADNEALLAFGPPPEGSFPMVQLSARRDLTEAAANLFAGLRALDAVVAKAGLAGIAAMPIPADGIGVALNDRLARAASGSGSSGGSADADIR